MRVLFAAAVVVFSIPAFAQVDVNVESGNADVAVPGMNVKIRTGGPKQHPAPAPPPARTAPPPRTIGVDAFSVEYGPMNGVPGASIKFLSPEGAMAEVWNEQGELELSSTVPFNFKGRGNTYYRFIITTPDGIALLDRKLELKQFIGGIARFRNAAPPPAPVVVAAPPPAAPPPAMGMPAADFDALLAAIDEASFSEEKIGVLETALTNQMFTCEQIGRLVDAYDFSDGKVKALELTRGRIVDPQNKFKILSHYTFSSDKEKAQALLR